MWRLSIRDLRRGFSAGSVSPADVMAHCLAAAEASKNLNAFVWREDPSELLRRAEESAERWRRGEPRGTLDGVPVSVKDNFCTSAGRPTTCGSAMLSSNKTTDKIDSYRPPYTATVVQRLKAAGAIIVGKTNLDEFSMGSGGVDSVFGPTRSLWRNGQVEYELEDDEGRTVEGAECGGMEAQGEGDLDWPVAGGSSGGSAASVCSLSSFASVGSDTGGSARIPAAWSGLVSLKPTYGAVSRHGLIPLVNSLDSPSVLARSAEDAAEVFDVISGTDERDSTTLDQPIPPTNLSSDPPDASSLTVGLPAEYRCRGMDEEVVEVWSDVADLLEAEGIKVRRVSLPHTKYSITCYSVLNPCEVASNMSRFDGLRFGLRGRDESSTEAMYEDSRRTGFNEVVRSRILAGNFFLLRRNYEEFFVKALKVRRLVKQDFDQAFSSGVDLLLTPATLTSAPTFRKFSSTDNRTQTTVHDYCTQPANLAGLPAATVPVRLSSSEHLPLGLQIVGQAGKDGQCLGLAKWIQDRVRFPRIKLKL